MNLSSSDFRTLKGVLDKAYFILPDGSKKKFVYAMRRSEVKYGPCYALFFKNRLIGLLPIENVIQET
jgi:hypothetical protein